jgi:hypothetical protein
MCFSPPKTPSVPLTPPPPKFLPPVLGDEGADPLAKKKLGKKRLQIPLGVTPASGLGIPTDSLGIRG